MFFQPGENGFEAFPQFNQNIAQREFWNEGYFVRTVGDKVASAVVQKYIKYHRREETKCGVEQPILF
jgi:REP element-mobilizing transposase RayT